MGRFGKLKLPRIRSLRGKKPRRGGGRKRGKRGQKRLGIGVREGIIGMKGQTFHGGLKNRQFQQVGGNGFGGLGLVVDEKVGACQRELV